MDVKGILKTGKSLVVHNLPTILTGIGISGVGVTAFFAGKGALEADRYLRETHEESELESMSLKDKLKETYPFYIPAVVTGAATVGCIAGANHLNLRKIATATTIATTTEKALIENREKIKELFGEKGLRKVDEKINEDHAAEYFKSLDNVYETGHGSVLCCEGYLTGLRFRANPEWVHKCVNDYNAELNAGTPRSMNDFLELLIPNIDINTLPSHGDEIGFNTSINGQLMEIVVDSGLLPDTHEPYLIFTQRNTPISNYDQYL